MKAKHISKIIAGILLLTFFIGILSLLVGAEWIMKVVLFFSDDVLCDDKNKDGVDDFCRYWNNGKLIRLEWDTNYDGKVDVWHKFFEDKDVLLFDSNLDGAVDFRETQGKDGKVLVEVDSNFDGTFDRVENTSN